MLRVLGIWLIALGTYYAMVQAGAPQWACIIVSVLVGELLLYEMRNREEKEEAKKNLDEVKQTLERLEKNIEEQRVLGERKKGDTSNY
jgi:hypothetical protein